MAPNPESTQRQAEQEHEANEQQREATPGPLGPRALRRWVHQRLQPRGIIRDELGLSEGNRLSVGMCAGKRRLQRHSQRCQRCCRRSQDCGPRCSEQGRAAHPPRAPRRLTAVHTAALAEWPPGRAPAHRAASRYGRVHTALGSAPAPAGHIWHTSRARSAGRCPPRRTDCEY